MNTRNIGLDFIRSIAIILVLIAHYSMFVSEHINTFPIMHGCGFWGVEIFFVLSGFLIGNILIRDVVSKGTWVSLYSFWRRRWYRTMPAYYLTWTLLVYLKYGFSRINFVNLVMLQNFFYAHRDAFFGVSWSLAVEQWFYLLVPFVIYILLKLQIASAKKILLYVCLLGIIFAPIERIAAALLFDEHWSDMRKSSFIRIDAFLFGILTSTILNYYPSTYQLIKKQLNILLLIAAAWLIFSFTQFKDWMILDNLFNRTLLFSITDLSIIPILIYCESSNRLNSWRSSWKEKLLLFISTTSYSVYLIHWDIQLVVHKIYSRGTPSYSKSIIFICICIIITYVISYIMYKFWEKPILGLCDNKRNIKSDISIRIKTFLKEYVY